MIKKDTFASSAALAISCLLAWSSGAAAEDVPCATSQSEQRQARYVTESELRSMRRGAPRVGSFDIVLAPGAGLSANPDALAAFERAAAQWEAFFSDPVTITIDADFADLGNPNVIGSAGAVFLSVDYESAAVSIADDAADESDDTIVASLPSPDDFDLELSASFTWSDQVLVTQANLKAIGLIGGSDSDGEITFNSGFGAAFDFDNSNGVGANAIDFESIAAHEIGHILGFSSAIDVEDYFFELGSTTGDFSPSALDLFRFHDETADDPASEAEFSTFTRSLTFDTADITDDIDNEWAMSTGAYNGDGRQASHWKDDALAGPHIGTMDPTYAQGTVLSLSPADVRALDLIGYDYTLCGNSVVDAGETCDDGNRLDADCCSQLCQLDGAATPCFGTSGACSAGECDGAGTCVDQIGPIEESVCLAAPNTKLQISLNDDPAKNKLQWQWNKGDGFDQSALGAPLVDSTYTLCVFDTSAGVPSLATSAAVLPSATLWTDQDPKGLKYKDKAGSSEGVTGAQLKTGVLGKTKAKMVAKGTGLQAPVPVGATFFTQSPSVIVQLHNSEGTCWTSSFGAASTTKNTDSQFKAMTK